MFYCFIVPLAKLFLWTIHFFPQRCFLVIILFDCLSSVNDLDQCYGSRIFDSDPGSWIWIFSFRIPDRQHWIDKECKYFLNVIRYVYPSSQIPDPDSFFHPGSRIRSRNTDLDIAIRNHVCDRWRGGERGRLENGRVLPVWLESASFVSLRAWKVGTSDCLFTVALEKSVWIKEKFDQVPVPDFSDCVRVSV